MPRTDRALAALCLLVAGCAPGDRSVTVIVGQVQVRLVPPRGWEHVDNGGRHEFRLGDMRMSLVDAGIATPEALASTFGEARELLRAGREREAIDRLSYRRAPVLAVRDREARTEFWRDWNRVAYDPARRTAFHLEPALEDLIARAHALPPIDGATFARWVAARELDTLRYQIERVEEVGEGESTWWLARTWTRVSHQYPRRFAARAVQGRLLVLDSGPHLPAEGERAFEALLASIRPPASDTPAVTGSR